MRKVMNFILLGILWLTLSSCQMFSPKPPARQTRFEPYGVCEHLGWLNLYLTETEVQRSLVMIQKAGVQWVRIDAAWSALEPHSGDFSPPHWQRLDYAINEAFRLGITPYLVVLATPRWASPKPQEQDYWTYAPKDLSTWTRFIEALGKRYHGKIFYWEINNEIDWPMFWKSGLPDYVETLKLAHDTLKHIDRRNRILLAGLATDGVHSFEYAGVKAESGVLQNLYNLGAGKYFNILALHPYSHQPNGGPLSVTKVETAYAVMQANDDKGKPIWITEIGLSTAQNPPGSEFSLDDQAQAVTNYYLALLELPYVHKVFWYNFRCKGIDPKDPEHNFGLINNDFSPRPAYQAYMTLTQTTLFK